MQDFVLTDPRILPFYDSFPRGFTCWQAKRNISRANIADLLHRILVVDWAKDDTSLAWTTWELDAFRFKTVKRLLRK